MARKKLMGARVSDDAREVIYAMMFLEGCSSVQELLGPVLEDLAQDWAEQPEVVKALELRELHQARSSGKVRSLRPASDGEPS